MTDLDLPATHSGFARLIGVSQQAVSAAVKGGLLRRGGTVREWLLAYCANLRKNATGREKDDQVAQQRARLLAANAEARERANAKAHGVLVDAREVEVAAFECGRLLRDRALGVPAKLAPKLATMTDPGAIEDLLRDALEAELQAVSEEQG